MLNLHKHPVSTIEYRTFLFEKIAALCGIVWFVFVMDTCFTWFFTWPTRNLIGALFVYFATFILNEKRQIVVTKNRLALLFTLAVLLIFVILSTGGLVRALLKFTPLLCISLWSKRTLVVFCEYFKNYIVFFSILSIIAEILFITGLLRYIPYIRMASQGNVQEMSSTYNYVYLYIINIPDTQFASPYYRVMGPLREAGHFSIFVGFAYFIEKVVNNKRNWWLITCGFMTLSPNFPLFFLIAEGYVVLSTKHVSKQLLRFLFVIGIIVVAYFFVPQNYKEEFNHIVFERSLDSSLENMESEGIQAIFDGRVNDVGMLLYQQFQNDASLSERLFGYHFVSDYVLSDYRYLIIHYGYIGLLLFFICTLRFSYCYKNKFYAFCVFLLAFAILLQRAWMFEQAYIWTMMLLATNAKTAKDQLIKCKNL